MSTTSESQAEWLGSGFWDQLDLLEKRHQRVREQHESARRGLEALGSSEDADFIVAWQRYCTVIEELDQATTDFEQLRTRTS